ncbi:glutamine amidotransferase-related protein [Trueperella pecoris]|uniref:glutamine amidotransferase-related protein n=1 Tax=Trueperella pecoris TaxID=2733571 RepID=UPI001ABE2CAA|nr:gamma-glutamyl-gamma-aminobutyrate hydrolase family protein [Trueperella pecoris]QTG74644.1 gamma-glutamyl-gamma-aminobutyrate hydrolase family protein [Trueperella pecoris]
MPFAFLAARPAGARIIRDDEYAAVLREGKLSRDALVYFSLEDRPRIDPTEYSGIIVSGSVYSYLEEHESKTAEQIAVEEVLDELNAVVLERDLPYLGLCYGLQSFAVSLGARLTRDYGEEIQAMTIELTEEGKRDAIFGSLPEAFPAVVGHTEAIVEAPAGTVVLASSELCPIQALRYGENVYGTQFHPEIGEESVKIRIDYYNGSKYFAPGQVDAVRARSLGYDYSFSAAVISHFINRYC